MGGQQGTTAQLVYDDPDSEGVLPKEFKAYKKIFCGSKDLTEGRIDCIVMDELPAKLLVEKTEDWRFQMPSCLQINTVWPSKRQHRAAGGHEQGAPEAD